MTAMTTNATQGFRPNTRLLAVGAAMTGLGSVVVATGAALVSLALVSAGRRWVQTWETAPGEVATRTLNQAKKASQAGLDAWRAGASMN
jgi:hypothetical protein